MDMRTCREHSMDHGVEKAVLSEKHAEVDLGFFRKGDKSFENQDSWEA